MYHVSLIIYNKPSSINYFTRTPRCVTVFTTRIVWVNESSGNWGEVDRERNLLNRLTIIITQWCTFNITM